MVDLVPFFLGGGGRGFSSVSQGEMAKNGDLFFEWPPPQFSAVQIDFLLKSLYNGILGSA